MTRKDQNDLIYLNALNRISPLGPKRIAFLLEHFKSARSAWEAPLTALKDMPDLQGSAEQIDRERKKIDPGREWDALQRLQIGCVSFQCPQYPSLLKQIPFPPPLLYYRGNLQAMDRPTVAIVGSRRCTFYGKEVAAGLAAELASAGVGIISGMALGIDTAAHRGALESGGYTAAVLGCGVDKCYPPQNADLMKQIAAEGAVISEFPAGTEPVAANFPRRNRIISGLSLGTVVVEATAKSGAIITANYALEQNREVFAVPGNVGSPYSRGCHRLIKEGAKLVESASDIIEELYIDSSAGEQLSFGPESPELTEEEKTLLAQIPYQPLHIDTIIRLSGTSPAAVNTLLLSLELKKQIRQTPGKYFCRI